MAARERAFVPTLVFIGLVISTVSSLGAPLIPRLAEELHTSLSSAQWSLTATLLVGAVSTPLLGRLGDGPHRRRVTLLCLAIVTFGCGLAAVADGLAVLVAGRAMQGVGLALLPLAMAEARDHLSEAGSPRVIAILSVTAAAGVGLGYPITGWIAEHAALSTAFWAGVAMTCVALLLGAVVLPRTPPSTRSARLDVPGAVVIAAGLVCLLIGVEKGPDWGWLDGSTLALLLAAAALLAAWARHELATADPLVDLRLVRHRVVLTANVMGALLGVAMYMIIALVTQLVQLDEDGFGLGEGVFVTGLTLVPLSLGSFFASRFLQHLHGRLGARAALSGGTLLVGLGAALMAATSEHLWQAFAAMGLVGLGLGLTFAALPGLIVGNTPRTETGSATGFYQVARYVGFSVGSGLSITLVRVFGEPASTAYRASFAVAAGICVAAAGVARLVLSRAV